MQDKIIKQNITDTLELNYMPYAMSVIVSRAIPEIDGFKPSHRKLLYTMFKMGLLKGNKVKSADVVGQTMRLNPHGDMAIYETLVRLTRGYDALLHPFIDSKGNFGKQFSRDMAFAASRYTEVKLAGICEEIFKDLEKNTVPFMENYNGSTNEPMLLPTTFPNLLVTPNQGIAVGMASSICSFNLKEICETTINIIKNPHKDLKETLLAPDFTTGGQLIYNEDEIDKLYKTGYGGFKVRGKYNYDEKNNCIEVYEIPYTTTSEAIIDKVIALIKVGKIKEITDIRDETGLTGLKIAIDLRKNVNVDILMEKLFTSTPLSDSFNCNFNILVDSKPKVMGVREILENWLVFRIKCIKGQLKYDIDKKTEKLELLEGLSKILLDIDKAIAIIRNTENENLVISNLTSGFSITENQAEYIAEIKLRNLNKEYLLNRINERDNLKNEIQNLTDLLNSETKIKDHICSELKDISKKYGVPRKTAIIRHTEIQEFAKESFIEDNQVKLFLSKDGYFKKITPQSLRGNQEQKTKDDDIIIQEVDSKNKWDVLFFTSNFNVYKSKCYDFIETKASNLGDYLPNILKSDADEKILFMTSTLDYEGFLLLVFENGKIAKVKMDSYSTKINRKKLVNCFSDKSKVVFFKYLLKDEDIVLCRDSDKAALLNTGLIGEKQTKNTTGVQALTLKKNSIISKVFLSGDFISEDVGFYRITKIPSTGHFLLDKDKQDNL